MINVLIYFEATLAEIVTETPTRVCWKGMNVLNPATFTRSISKNKALFGVFIKKAF